MSTLLEHETITALRDGWTRHRGSGRSSREAFDAWIASATSSARLRLLFMATAELEELAYDSAYWYAGRPLR